MKLFFIVWGFALFLSGLYGVIRQRVPYRVRLLFWGWRGELRGGCAVAFGLMMASCGLLVFLGGIVSAVLGG